MIEFVSNAVAKVNDFTQESKPAGVKLHKKHFFAQKY
jgi:hypothetical protein